jgi:hypothetical protein
MDMKVAGATLCDNIVGKAQLNTVFTTTTGSITIPITYLIAHKLNGYQSILGAEMLTNPRLIKATTPRHIHLNDTYQNAVIPLVPITKPPNFNSTQVEEKPFSKFRGLVVSRKENLYFISVSGSLGIVTP